MPRRSSVWLAGSVASLAVVVAVLFVGTGALPQENTTVADGLVDATKSISDEVASVDEPAQVSTTTAPVVEPEVVEVQPETTEVLTILDVDAESSLVATALITEGTVDVWADPLEDAPAWSLAVPTEFGGDRHFLVLGETDEWFKISVPVRPNESIGWIPKEAVTLSVSEYRVQVDVSERAVRVWKSGELVIDTTSAVGQSRAPTPLGNFYIRDVLPWDATSVYGPYVIALSAYSEDIDQINGGDAVVAIHGTSRPALLGQAVSLGCVRLHNDDITLLAETVPVGTPVEIVA